MRGRKANCLSDTHIVQGDPSTGMVAVASQAIEVQERKSGWNESNNKFVRNREAVAAVKECKVGRTKRE
jgi:hypothetical protein